jgi:hypothetical protein
MALQSPGVQVTVIDESFYTPAEPGTTPLIVVATAQDKINGAGTGTASGTRKENVGKAFRMTSQRDLLDFFGVPFFEKTATGNPIHGGERNEYGLLAAYSLMGVTNSAFIVRADVDLNQLEPRAAAPGAEPDDGQWWVNTASSAWGIKEWNGEGSNTTGGQRFANKVPIVLTDDDNLKVGNDGFPLESVGSIGDYAVVFQTINGSGTFNPDRETVKFYFKSPGNGDGPPTYTNVSAGEWVLVGSPEWTASWPTLKATASFDPDAGGYTGGSFEINGTVVIVGQGSSLTDLVNTINGISGQPAIKARAVNNRLWLYSNATDNLRVITISDISSEEIAGEIGITNKSYFAPALRQSPHTQVPQWKLSGTGQIARPTGSIWINTTEPNGGSRWRVSQWNSASSSWISFDAPLYRYTHEALFFLDRSGGGSRIPVNSLFVQYNSNEESGNDESPETATFRVWRRYSSEVSITATISDNSGLISGINEFDIKESLSGQQNLDSVQRTVSFNAATGSGSGQLNAGRLASAINALGLQNVVADVSGPNANIITITHIKGGDIRLLDGLKQPVGQIFDSFNIGSGLGTENFYELPSAALEDSTIQGEYLVSGWTPLAASNFAALGRTPLNEPVDGQLWYNPEFSEVDIMVHNGEVWVGYQNVFSETNSRGPSVSASNPWNSSTKTGDLWISTADLENFPIIYRYDSSLPGAESTKWILVDKTDQVTEEGILFADARYGVSGATGDVAATIPELLTSNYVDPDCPDPALYPRGMLLWNTRRSGGNVKRYANNYINQTEDNIRFNSIAGGNNDGQSPVSGESMSNYATDRWITASPNNEDGSGSFGRKAQRGVVVRALKSAVDTSEEARDEERRNFNIIAAPGYPELLSNLINLNLDRGLTAFVVGDTPLRLKSDATTLINWGTNANLVLDNGDDGIVSFDEYAAVFYPNGFTTDLGGSNAVVPASHMMLRTITLSDQASYPWFAPAGTRRGGITNATAVGYIDSLTGEFQTVSLNEGQRDVLYDLKVNPIPFFVGVGLVAYGQKTRARNASALDRINVSRLVVYLRSQLKKLARPYIFEPNDKITRDEVKQAVESLLLELVGLRAIFDFAVVCDETNNTPSRIDRNELWVDIAIEPVKAVEFIYIPLRVKNTGEI